MWSRPIWLQAFQTDSTGSCFVKCKKRHLRLWESYLRISSLCFCHIWAWLSKPSLPFSKTFAWSRKTFHYIWNCSTFWRPTARSAEPVHSDACKKSVLGTTTWMSAKRSESAFVLCWSSVTRLKWVCKTARQSKQTMLSRIKQDKEPSNSIFFSRTHRSFQPIAWRSCSF